MKKEILLIGLLVLAIAISGCTSSSSSGNTALSVGSEPSYYLYEPFVIDDLQYTFTKTWLATEIGTSYFSTKANGEFYIVKVEIKNVGNDPVYLSSSNIMIVDGQGRTYETDPSASIYLSSDGRFDCGEAFLFDKLNPGLTQTGCVVFDTPVELRGHLEVVDNSFFSTKKVIVHWVTRDSKSEEVSTKPEEYPGKSPKEVALKEKDVIYNEYRLIEEKEAITIEEVKAYTSTFENDFGIRFFQAIFQFKPEGEIDSSFTVLKNDGIRDGFKEWESFSMGEYSQGLKYEKGDTTAYRLMFKKQFYIIDLVVETPNEQPAKAILNEYGKIIESRIG